MNFGPPEVSAGSKVCQEEGEGGGGWGGNGITCCMQT